MNKSNINISSQSGVIVTLEVSILMVVCGISAVGFGILLAAHLPEIVTAWLLTLKGLVTTP